MIYERGLISIVKLGIIFHEIIVVKKLLVSTLNRSSLKPAFRRITQRDKLVIPPQNN